MKNLLRAPLRWVAFFSFVVVGIIAGCSSLSGLVARPEVELESVTIQDPSLTAATLVFGIRVTNPNPFKLYLASLQYALKLNQQGFVQGELPASINIPGKDKGVVQLPVRVTYLKLYNSILDMAQKGTVDYQLTGTASVSGIQVPFDLGGKTELPKSFPAE